MCPVGLAAQRDEKKSFFKYPRTFLLPKDMFQANASMSSIVKCVWLATA
jgi:hypothetical protein